jgi:hypothetical protein
MGMESLVITAFSNVISDRRFWTMKIKIAILAAATFAALC